MTLTTMILMAVAFSVGMLCGGRSWGVSTLGGFVAFCVAFTGWAALYFVGEILVQLSQVQS